MVKIRRKTSPIHSPFLFKYKDFEPFTLHPECSETLGNLGGAGEKMDVFG